MKRRGKFSWECHVSTLGKQTVQAKEGYYSKIDDGKEAFLGDKFQF